MALLYTADGDEVFAGGLTRADIVAAIQAAAIVEEWSTAQEIADRYGMTTVCLKCAYRSATTTHYCNREGKPWRVCVTCHHDLNPKNFADTKIYMDGLIKRDVQ